MSTAAFTVNITQLDAEDQRTIRYACDKENRIRRETAVAELDFSTAQLRKTYYETLLAGAMKEIHKRNTVYSARATDNQKPFQDLKSAWADASPEQRAAAIKAMTTPVTG